MTYFRFSEPLYWHHAATFRQ